MMNVKTFRPIVSRLCRTSAVVSRSASVLTGKERENALSLLTSTGWSAVDGRDAIQKKYEFKDFVEAWGFMSRSVSSVYA